MKRVIAAAVVGTSVAASACLFPSLDSLGGAPDASEGGLDVAIEVGSDADAGDATVGPDADVDAGPCANDDPSIVAHYTFDEGAGTVVHDCSPNGYDAVLAGNNASTHWTAGRTGSAVLFVPADGICVMVTSPQANQSGGALTIAAWITLLDPGGGYVIGQRTQTGYAWRIDVESTDAGADLGFAVGLGDGSGNDEYADTIVTTGAWHHVAGVFDPNGGVQAIYLDGVQTLAPQAAAAIVPDPVSTTIRIGCRGDDSSYFPGVIDDVRVYSRALSSTEVSALAK